MKILGLYGSFGWDANKSFLEGTSHVSWVHDAGATLFIDGKHICSISEERLTRIKYDGNYPENSINYCLSTGNLTNEDIDLVCIPSMCVPIFYKRLKDGVIHKVINAVFPNAKIKIVSHHQSHAAAAIFTCDFNEGSFLTLDGAGSIAYGVENRMFLTETNSIGYFNKEKGIFRFFNGVPGANNFGSYYHMWAHQIYCRKMQMNIHGFDEKYRETFDGKIMGLSAYGNAEQYDVWKDYQMSADDYEEIPYVHLNENFKENSGIDFKNVYDFKSPDDMAALLQKNFECALLDYATELRKQKYLDENVCFSGGSFLNVLGNTVLKQSKLFKNIHIPPYTNDTGLHFGAACYALFKNDEPIQLPDNIALFGREYTNDEIEVELIQNKISYTKHNFEELCEFTAQQLNENKIIGWFQNRSEFGPRALGSRSLLMHPGPKENKDIMNSRVKHREYWRPFAGIILEENLKDYFNEDFCSPYMLYSLTVKNNKLGTIGAITHEDNSCRIQTVNNKYNPQITLLLQKFKELSGLPVLLNTSFNDNGEPIVETPSDAIRSFMNMDIDYLVIGDFLVKKN
jgi:carbamoyltransferase